MIILVHFVQINNTTADFLKKHPDLETFPSRAGNYANTRTFIIGLTRQWIKNCEIKNFFKYIFTGDSHATTLGFCFIDEHGNPSWVRFAITTTAGEKGMLKYVNTEFLFFFTTYSDSLVARGTFNYSLAWLFRHRFSRIPPAQPSQARKIYTPVALPTILGEPLQEFRPFRRIFRGRPAIIRSSI